MSKVLYGVIEVRDLTLAMCMANALLLFVGCSEDRHIDTLVLSYEDFGPQVVAHELLGPEWYQWDSHGYESDDFEYNINVVVFDGVSEEAVSARYKTVVGEVDYRYVSKPNAVRYLKRKISECESAIREDDLPGVQGIVETLTVTLRLIESMDRKRCQDPIDTPCSANP